MHLCVGGAGGYFLEGLAKKKTLSQDGQHFLAVAQIETSLRSPGIVVNAFNPSTREAGVGESVGSRLTWSIH